MADASGNLFWTPTSGTSEVVNLLTTDGKFYTIAGTGDDGFSGDGGPALDATFSNIKGLAIDASCALYVTDLKNNRIRKLTPDGSTGGGDSSGGDPTDGDGPDTTVELPTGEVGPIGLDLDSDFGDQMVRQTATYPVAGDKITVAIFITEGGSSNSGFEVTLTGDPAELSYDSYQNKDIFASAIPIPTQGEGSIQISNAIFGAGVTGSADSGTGGQAVFTAAKTFSGVATITLSSGKLGTTESTVGPGAAFVVIGGATEVVLDPASPEASNWDGDDNIGFGDFLIFTGGFGANSGEDGFDTRLDLDGDGNVRFGDFLLFAAVFGQTIEY